MDYKKEFELLEIKIAELQWCLDEKESEYDDLLKEKHDLEDESINKDKTVLIPLLYNKTIEDEEKQRFLEENWYNISMVNLSSIKVLK